MFLFSFPIVMTMVMIFFLIRNPVIYVDVFTLCARHAIFNLTFDFYHVLRFGILLPLYGFMYVVISMNTTDHCGVIDLWIRYAGYIWIPFTVGCMIVYHHSFRFIFDQLARIVRLGRQWDAFNINVPHRRKIRGQLIGRIFKMEHIHGYDARIRRMVLQNAIIPIGMDRRYIPQDQQKEPIELVLTHYYNHMSKIYILEHVENQVYESVMIQLSHKEYIDEINGRINHAIKKLRQHRWISAWFILPVFYFVIGMFVVCIRSIMAFLYPGSESLKSLLPIIMSTSIIGIHVLLDIVYPFIMLKNEQRKLHTD
jgi:hypothetical protein